ncbi:MAG: hypothetical protein BM557_06060 [Flavobacterium sp. MedPE-SWcel]|nr:MAG: hypothetical protein BM557_06060 [Flavobacterium sp. MedPE-SWcel]
MQCALYAQTDPTLAVGLETLTMNKGTIDVEALTEIIMEKQKEIKGEALKRFMLKLFPESDYTTKFYVQNSLNILLNEKNPKVIEKEILELTTNYALALGVTYALYNKYNAFKEIKNVNSSYTVYVNSNPNVRIRENYLDLKRKVIGGEDDYFWFDKLFNRNLLKLEYEIYEKNNEIGTTNSSLGLLTFEENSKKNKEIAELSELIKKIKLRRGIGADNVGYNTLREAYIQAKNNQKDNVAKLIKCLDFEGIKRLKLDKDLYDLLVKVDKELRDPTRTLQGYKIPFGHVLDVVSLSLSEVDLLQEKGFFKNKIDYTKDDFYLGLSDKNKGKEYQDALNILKEKISVRIRNYVAHYDIIIEFLKSDDYKSNDILEEVKKLSFKKLASYMVEGKDVDFNSIIKDLDDSGNIRDGLYKLELLTKLKTEKVSEFKHIDSLDVNVKDIKTILEKYEEIKQMDIKHIQIDAMISKGSSGFKKLNISNLEVIDSQINVIKKASITYDKVNSKRNGRMEYEFKSDGVAKELTDNEVINMIANIDSVNVSSVNYGTLVNSFNGAIKKLNDNTDIINKRLIDINKIDKGEVEKNIESVVKDIGQKGFFKSHLNYLMDIIQDGNYDSSVVKDSTTVNKTAGLMSGVYIKLKELSSKDDVSLKDINYFEDNFLQRLIELKLRDGNNKAYYDKILSHANILVPMLKIKVLTKINGLEYDKELMMLLEFIAKIDKLDKAETFTTVVDMLRMGSESVEDNLKDGKFKDSYLVFINAMKKYSIVNTNENYVELDVASTLNDLKTYYDKNNTSHFSLYLSLGLNQNFFLNNKFEYPATTSINADGEEVVNASRKISNIGFASEKLGLEINIHSFKKYKGYSNVIKDDIYLNERTPFINDLYAVVYGSGLLYSLANTTTDEDFDFVHIGAGLGVRFYNALDVNFTIGTPFVKDQPFGNNFFVGVGFDIPLGEYLEKIGGK